MFIIRIQLILCNRFELTVKWCHKLLWQPPWTFNDYRGRNEHIEATQVGQWEPWCWIWQGLFRERLCRSRPSFNPHPRQDARFLRRRGRSRIQWYHTRNRQISCANLLKVSELDQEACQAIGRTAAVQEKEEQRTFLTGLRPTDWS